MSEKKTISILTRLLFSGTTGIIGSYLLFYRPDQVYLNVFSTSSWTKQIITASLLTIISFFIPATKHNSKKTFIFLPVLTCILLFPESIFSMLLGILFFVWLIHHTLNNNCFIQKIAIGESTTKFIIWGCFIAWGCWYFIIQYLAFNSIFLLWQDWGEYAEHYLKIISGNCRLADYLIGAGHFNPLCNILMSIGLLIVRSPYTIFAINSLLLASLIPLSYFAAKSLKLPTSKSLMCSLILAFNPIIYNQCLTLFYGFHPVNFLIPLFFGIFIAYKKRHFSLSIILSIATIFIQETVLIIWFGFSLYLVFSSRRKITGIAGLIICPFLFFLITNKLMPYLNNTPGEYAQGFHFAALGNNMLEVLLSPILRPKVFLATLFQWQNFAFILIIALPFIAIFYRITVCIIKKFGPANILSAPFADTTDINLLKNLPSLIILLPLASGVILQSSPDVKNPLQQYGLELTILLSIFWLVSISVIYINNKQNKNLFNFLISNFISAVIIFAFFGINTFWSTNSIAKRPSAKPLIEHLNKTINDIPEQNKRILAPQRLRGHFCFRYSVASPNARRQPGDFIILDLNDIVWYNLEKLHKDLALDSLVQPLTHINWYGKNFILYAVTPAPLPKKLPFIRHCNLEQLLQEALTLQTYPNGKLLIVNNELTWLVIKQSEKNYKLKLQMLSPAGKIENHDIPFANGVLPLSIAKPGCCFIITPPDGKLLDINFEEL